MQQTIREVCVSEVQHSVLLPGVLSIGGKLVRSRINRRFLFFLHSKKHNQCSEGFYRDQIQSDIKTAPSATAQERLNMIELLKRFEESDAEGEDLEDENEDGDALAQRLKGIDLGMPLLKSLSRLISSTDASGARFSVSG